MPGPGRKFEKGNDPRRAKGGRPALASELRARCLKAVDEHVLAYWLDEVIEREREVITPAGPMTMTCRGPHAARCSELLANYGLGKPVQHIEGKIEHAVETAKTEQLIAWLPEALAALEADSGRLQ